MAYQGQVLTFTVPSSGPYSGSQTVYFEGNEILNDQAWVCLQGMDLSYNNGKGYDYRAINQCVPTISSIAGTAVTVNLEFLYSSENQTDPMPGRVDLLVTADVS